jgi:hypothetical protein
MSREQKAIKTLFVELTRSPLQTFPEPRGRLDTPNEQGVYIIYDPRGRVIHVGRTPSGDGGLRQRLNNHLHGASSFTVKYLKGHGAKLRRDPKRNRNHQYRCLVVKNPRHRALLEAYAVGFLCPAHVGLGLPALP